MVTNLQFAAVAAYLIWCLVSSLSGVLGSDRDGAETSEIDENDKIATSP